MLIAIEGQEGVGKSSLAAWIAVELWGLEPCMHHFDHSTMHWQGIEEFSKHVALYPNQLHIADRLYPSDYVYRTLDADYAPAFDTPFDAVESRYGHLAEWKIWLVGDATDITGRKLRRKEQTGKNGYGFYALDEERAYAEVLDGSAWERLTQVECTAFVRSGGFMQRCRASQCNGTFSGGGG